MMLAIPVKLCQFRVKRTATVTDFVTVVAEDEDSALDAACEVPVDWAKADPEIEPSDAEYIGTAEE
jgi:hypothetical protein